MDEEGNINRMNEQSHIHNAHPRFSGKSWTITILALTLAIVIAGVLVTVPHFQAAHASGATLTVVPKSASYSAQTGIVVKGQHFAAGEPVKIYWNYTGPATGTLVATATANATKGAFTTSFPVPLNPTGTYTIAGVGQTSGFIATDTFQLLPQLYGIPEAGGANSAFNVYGNAFAGGETVNIYSNYTGPGTGTLLGTAIGNLNGSFTVKVTIPTGTIPGSLPITGVGQNSSATASFPFVVYQPTLTLAPLSGSSGTLLTMTAYGFQKNEKINIFWNNGLTPVLVGKTDSNVYGYMPPTTFTVPAGTTQGVYPLKAVGQTSGTTVTTNFTVITPASSFGLTSGPVGASVNVSGQGYNPNEAVNVLWGYNGPGTGTNIASFTAGGSGVISGNFTVPTASAGAQTVALIGAISGIVTTNAFTVATGLAVSSARTSPGTGVNLAGTGYQANESVNIYLDTTSGTLLTTATADANGNISQNVTLPASTQPGSHNLVGVGQTSTTSFMTSVTLDTSWGNYGFDPAQDRLNPYENTLNTSNAGSLNLKWTGNMAKNFQGSPVYANSTIYAVSITGTLNAFDATSGALKWKFSSKTNFNNLAAPVVDPATGMVFFGTVGYQSTGIPSPLYALDAQTGALKWSMIMAWNVYGPPTVALKTLYVGVARGANPTQIYAIDEITGKLDWQNPINGSIWGAIAVDASTNTAIAFITNPASMVVAFDATSGTMKWQSPIAGSSSSSQAGSGIAIANGSVYFNGKNGNLYKLREIDGSSVWTTYVGVQPTGQGNIASPAIANGVVYAGAMDNNLNAVDDSTGALLWKKNIGLIYGSPVVANGVVYLATLGGKRIYAINATSKAILFNYLTGGLIYSSPIVVNGWLYCGSTDGKLYAFSL
jgi:outer membrane protein assembly factor BamB